MLHHRPGSISSPRVSSSGSSGARAGQQRGKPLLGSFLKGGRRGRREKGGLKLCGCTAISVCEDGLSKLFCTP